MSNAVWKGPIAVARARRGVLLVPLVAATLLVFALMPGTFDPVPFRDGVFVARWPLLVSVPGFLLAVLLQPPDAVMERLAGQPLPYWRLAWVSTCLIALGVPCFLITGFDPSTAEIALRNHGLVAAATMLTAVIAGTSSAWIPGASFVTLSFWYGTFTSNADARVWALLQQPVGDHRLTLIAISGCVGACALYAVRDARAST